MLLRCCAQFIRHRAGAATRTFASKQDDVTRDLFMAFCHAEDEHNAEPYLSISDLSDLLTALGERPSDRRVADLVSEFDLDGDGKVQYDEFLRAKSSVLKREDSTLATHGMPTEEELDHIITSFGTLDKNGDGFVCVDDLTGLLSTTKIVIFLRSLIKRSSFGTARSFSSITVGVSKASSGQTTFSSATTTGAGCF